MTNCSKSKCIINVVAVALFIFFYDFVVHGIVLADAYKVTANLWRPEAEMQDMWVFCIVIHLALAVLYSALYKKTTSACACCAAKPCVPECTCKNSNQIKNGVCFGVVLGLILAVINGSAYMHIPIPGSLAISWFFASLFQGIGVGVLLALINNKKGCTVNG